MVRGLVLAAAVFHLQAGAAEVPAAAPVASAVPENCAAPPERSLDSVAQAVGATNTELEWMFAARGLDLDAFCALPQAVFKRYVRRLHEPKAGFPGEWARQRAMQQASADGRVKPDGLLQAQQQRRSLLAAQVRAQGKVSVNIAGITPGAWVGIGPTNVGGRVRAMVIHPSNPNALWIGSAGGGMWKSSDGGANWSIVNDFMGNLAITTMAIDRLNPSVMYAGTGEGFFNIDAIRGVGVFKSTDGGLTWNHLPSTLPSTAIPGWYWVNRLAIHPTNSNIVLAATRNGLFRSSDGGATWSLRTSASQPIGDVQFDPLNGNRAVYGPAAFGPAATVAYSDDAGVTWSNSDLPASSKRVEIALSNQSGVAYASVDDATNGSVYRSTDGGRTWVFRSSPHHLSSQGWYDNVVWVDPVNSNHVVVGGLNLHRSLDGGLTFTLVPNGGVLHVDHHRLLAAPNYDGVTNKTIYSTNDGGVFKTTDIGATTTFSGWQSLNPGLSITQFYSGAGHNGVNGRILGGTQDNGTRQYPFSTGTWGYFYGGDGGFTAVDPVDGNTAYTEYIYLQIARTMDGGLTVNPITTGLTDTVAGKSNFIAPYVLDPNNPNTLIAGGESLWRSTNAKAASPTWAVIQGPTNGGGAGNLASAVAVAQGNSNLIWVGKNNGTLFRTTNGTAATPTWSTSGVGTLPARSVLALLVDKGNTNIVYAGFGGYDANNLWRSTDGGNTWASLSAGLPSAPVRSIQRHPSNPNFLYIGTEVGVYASENGGASWSTSNDGPASVSVDQLFWLDATTLVAATHGRSMFRISVAGPTPTFTLSVSKVGTGTGVVSSSPAGINCGTTCAAPFNSGASVTLTAAADAGSTFTGWSGACTGSGVCVVSMTVARAVTATFAPAPVPPLGDALDANGLTWVTSGNQAWAGQTAVFYAGGSAARSGAITHSQTSTLQTTVNGPGTLTFWWKVSSEAAFDFLTLYVDGVAQTGAISGETAWAQRTVTLGAGSHVIQWVYSKDNSVSAGLDAGFVDAVVFTPTVVTVSLAEALDNGTLPWLTSGTLPWAGQTAQAYAGGDAARSGAITHSQTSTLETTVNGAGVLTFWWRVSSEAAYDFLTLYVDGVAQTGAISGETAWAQRSVTLGAGSHVIRWVYSKDNSVNAGLDAGFVDAVVFTPAVTGVSLAEALDNNTLTWLTSGNLAWEGQTAQSFAGGDAARSGAITHSQTSTLQTTVNGPGVLNFWWRVSSEAAYDFLRLYVDGVLQPGGISGETAWAQQSVTLGAGSHVIQWVYAKDNTVSAGLDAGFVDAVTFTPSSSSVTLAVTKAGTGSGAVASVPSGIDCGTTCSASFPANSAVSLGAAPVAGSTFAGWSGACTGTGGCSLVLANATTVTATFNLNSTALDLQTVLDANFGPWLTSGNANWFGQTSVFTFGGSAARSGAVADNGQSVVSVNVTGPGTLRFWWKVSSEPAFDFLRFRIDGVVQAGAISGETAWAQQTWAIPAGAHTLSWVYVKDVNTSAGSDAGWLDKVEWVPAAVPALAKATAPPSR